MRLTAPLLAAAFACAAPAPALAQNCPTAAGNCTRPNCIAVVGSTAGVVDPAGEFKVTVKDIANRPCQGVLVVVDFSGYQSLPNDIRISTTQPFPGLHQVQNTVAAYTDVNGVATFRILGGANNLGNSPGRGAAGAAIYATGVSLGHVQVMAFDQDLSGGVGANDLSLWLADKFAPGGPYYGRSDYDCDGSLGANDLSVWVGFKFANGSTTSAPPPFIP